MQSDRELLELAAKAAGYREFQYCETSGGLQAIYVEDGNIGFWDPLTDDGDALRLAVKLRISVAQWKEDVSALHPSTNREFPEACASCPYAATRRAIVRAAAKLAQAHPDHKDGGANA